ncbi:hypothetical protein GW916_15930 [bacterium]|nr:hypothetical protein [bacterium]
MKKTIFILLILLASYSGVVWADSKPPGTIPLVPTADPSWTQVPTPEPTLEPTRAPTMASYPAPVSPTVMAYPAPQKPTEEQKPTMMEYPAPQRDRGVVRVIKIFYKPGFLAKLK